MKRTPKQPLNPEEFGIQNASANSPVQRLVRQIAREVRRQKWGYLQLKYIFRSVRVACDIEVPSTPKKLYELPSDVELTAFYGVIKNPQHRLIFEFLELTGLRVAEATRMRVDRINFQTLLMFVSEGKGKKDRIMILSRRLAEKLQLYLEGKNNKYVFESNRGTRFSTRWIEKLCKRYKEKAGIEKDLTPHVFRHLLMTRLAENNVPKEKRALLAGHADDSTQDVYTHLALAGMKQEVLDVLKKIEDQRS